MITEQKIEVEIEKTAITPEHEAATKLTRAMKVLSDVARIYKKYGKSARWHAIEPAHNEPKRAARLAQAAVQTGQYACGRCGLPFVAQTKERCQCKVKTKHRA